MVVRFSCIVSRNHISPNHANVLHDLPPALPLGFGLHARLYLDNPSMR